MSHLGRPFRSRRGPDTLRSPLGFTLVEIMIVVAILGVVMAISLPSISQVRKHAPMIQTIKELREVCSHARARAIFSGQTTQVVFRPYERTFAISGGAGAVGPRAPRAQGRLVHFTTA